MPIVVGPEQIFNLSKMTEPVTGSLISVSKLIGYAIMGAIVVGIIVAIFYILTNK